MGINLETMDPDHRFAYFAWRALHAGDANDLALHLPNAVHANLKHMLARASELGHEDCVSLLLDGSPSQLPPDFISPLEHAAREGHLGCVRLLIPRSPHCAITDAIVSSARFGHLDCLIELLAVNQRTHMLWLAKDLATENNHARCVEVVLNSIKSLEAMER